MHCGHEHIGKAVVSTAGVVMCIIDIPSYCRCCFVAAMISSVVATPNIGDIQSY